MTQKTCTISKCDLAVESRDMCHKHYHFFRNQGLFSDKKCGKEGCDRPFYSRDMCSKHYQQVSRQEANERAKHNARVFAAQRVAA